MLSYSERLPTFAQRTIANLLIMVCCGLIVLGISAMSAKTGAEAAFTSGSFTTLAAFLDFKQVVLPIAGGFVLYLVVTIVAHQSRSRFGPEEEQKWAQKWRELVHAEVSSILLSSSSLAFTLGALQVWTSSYVAGLKTMAWWPVGLLFAYLLRPKSQDT